ncbi:MAG: SusC/RagA family TonB-linked outer membrane protein, partial [Ginsengibacter sp.]
MKLTVFLLIVMVLQVSAKGFSQSVSISVKNTPVQQVFEQVKKQTGLSFLWDEKTLKDTRPVTLSFSDASVKDVMDAVIKNQPITYTIIQNMVVIKLRQEAQPKASLTQILAVSDVRGKVTDDNGKPLPDVSVVVKGTTKGATTDANGDFQLSNVEPNATIVFSNVGYETQSIALKGRSVINITLKLHVKVQDEVVVVGYGTTKRKDLTGSVASINPDELKNTTFVSIDQALSGKAAGVQVIQGDGSPGGMAKIRIRGGTSLLGGNDPLYIIDGIPVQIQNRYLQSAAEIVSPVATFSRDADKGTISGSFSRGLNSLAGLNINDIESIDILKDASATAIYGSKAVNGVVIITTKKGKKDQKPIFDFNYYAGASVPIKEKLLNADQYKAVLKEAAKNLNDARAAANPVLPPDAFANSILNDPNFFGTANTDWLSLILRNGIAQNADISVRGGGTNSRYYTSLAYTKQNGAIIGTDFERISGKMNLDNEITKRFRFITNLDYSFSKNNITNGVYSQALYAPPTFTAYNPDGSIRVINESDLHAFNGFQSPLSLLNGVNKANTAQLLGSIAAEYDILKSLKFKSVVSVNYSNYHQDNYTSSTTLIAGPYGNQSTSPGIATQGQTQATNIFVENTLTWDKQFNENNRINFLAGTSWQKSRQNSFTASGEGFPDDKYLNNLSSAALALAPAGLSGQNSLLSFYMRANYALKERYLFTFTGRSDISSKFPKNNRVGYFPSGGIAWRASEERFLKSAKWLNELKFRASAGYTGTQNIGDNLFYTLFSPASYLGTNALTPSQLGNPDLRWENTLQKDAGVDIAMFNNRLKIAAGVYEKITDGVLYTTIVPSSSGFTSLVSNIAKISNKGIELDVRGDFIRNKGFQWTGDINISQNRSKVLAISNDLAVQENGYVRIGSNALVVGQPLGVFYGRKFLGILTTQKQVDDYKAASYLA